MVAEAHAAERRFVREALLSLGGERAALRESARAVRDWSRVVALACEAAVGEAVWAAVVLRDSRDEIPEPARSTLREFHANGTACNAVLLAEAATAQAALLAAGIESVALKGTALVAAHYPDIGGRLLADVDLLFRAADAPRAEEVLEKAGFRDPLQLVRYDGAGKAIGVRKARDEVQFDSPRGVIVDIQDRIAGGAPDGSDVEGVFERSRLVEWQGRSIRIPSPADLAAGVCLHVFAHHANSGPLLQRHLADVAVLIGSGAVGWDEIAERMPGKAGADALDASRRLLETGDPGAVTSFRRSVGVRARHWQDTFTKVGGSPAGTVRILFPARGYMSKRYGVPENSPFLPLYYLWRPVRGLWTLVTGR